MTVLLYHFSIFLSNEWGSIVTIVIQKTHVITEYTIFDNFFV